VFLEGAVPLVKSLHREIVRLGKRLDDAASSEESARLRGKKVDMSEAYHAELSQIVSDMKSLLSRIDQDIPLIQLAISSSGERLSSVMSPGISPSRLMQAGFCHWAGDQQFRGDPTRPAEIGPSFTLSLYMLFLGHSQTGLQAEQGNAASVPTTQSSGETQSSAPYGLGEGERKPIWQEVMHKARVRIRRTPLNWTFDSAKGYVPKGSLDSRVNGNGHSISAIALLGHSDEYAYHLEIVEDLDDGRLHEDDGFDPQPFDGVPMAGIRESIPLHQVSKIFYTDTGRILNIKNATEGENNPVLLIKRDPNAEPPIKLRQAWFEEATASGHGSRSSTPSFDDQREIDHQLREETEPPEASEEAQSSPPKVGNLPPHLDPEWLALEVYADDNDESDSETEDEEDPDVKTIYGPPKKQLLADSPSAQRQRSSVDSNLVAQIRNLSVQTPSSSPARDHEVTPRVSSSDSEEDADETADSSAKSLNITSSLSLLEMIIRLASLQEFQQISYLAAPDYILNFFLEETSTTGLKGEARWQMRNKTKRHVGFDPYTDTPTKQTS